MVPQGCQRNCAYTRFRFDHYLTETRADSSSNMSWVVLMAGYQELIPLRRHYTLVSKLPKHAGYVPTKQGVVCPVG